MSDLLKVSGKKTELPKPGKNWKFESRPGGWIVATHGSERVRFMALESKGRISASLDGQLYFGEIAQVSSGASSTAGSAADLIAQFPGKVRKILVAEGAVVKEGEPLLLVEAMKMEFAIKAPFNGKITRIRVKEAQQLAPGDQFLDMEAAKA